MFYMQEISLESFYDQKSLQHQTVKGVGKGGAEGLQSHQYIRITLVKGVSNPTNIQGLL